MFQEAEGVCGIWSAGMSVLETILPRPTHEHIRPAAAEECVVIGFGLWTTGDRPRFLWALMVILLVGRVFRFDRV